MKTTGAAAYLRTGKRDTSLFAIILLIFLADIQTVMSSDSLYQVFSRKYPGRHYEQRMLSINNYNVFLQSKHASLQSRLIYSSYFGSAGGEGTGAILRVTDNIHIFGSTDSRDLPNVRSVAQDGFGGGDDGFISKFSQRGRTHDFSIYLGGGGPDLIGSAQVDMSGNIIVAGYTTSSDFPVTQGAYQTKYGGGDVDGFIAKFDSGCTKLLFSTYIGGRGADEVIDIAVAPDGTIYAVGYTDSYSTFPRTADAAQRWHGGGEDDMFLVAIDSSGRILKYGTFFGGNGHDEAYTVTVLPDGRVAIGGLTSSSNIPASARALQESARGGEDGLIVIFDSTLQRVAYCSYFGGGGQDSIERLRFSAGDLYLTGWTTSRDLPATEGVVQPRKCEPNGPNESVDSWLLRLDTAGFRAVFCSYIGGEAEDKIRWFDIYGTSVILGGSSTSSKYPVTMNAERLNKYGYRDIVITLINNSGKNILYSTYFGGNDWESIFSMVITENLYIALTGYTTSSDFPVTPDAFQPKNAGDNDAFITILDISDLLMGVAIAPHPETADIEIFGCSPQPFREEGFSITYKAAARDDVVLRICDVFGRTVEERRDENAGGGTRSVHFRLPESPPGVYYCIVEAGASRKIAPIMKIE